MKARTSSPMTSNIVTQKRTAVGRRPRNAVGMREVSGALVWLVVFTIPWQQTVNVGIAGLSRAIGLGAAVLGALSLVIERRRPAILDAHILTLAFAGLGCASITWTIDAELTLTAASTMAQSALLVLLAWEFCRGERAVGLARAFVWGTSIPIGQVIYAQVTGVSTVDNRIRVGTLQPNDLAFTICLAIPLAWFLARRVRGLATVLHIAFIPAALLAVALTASRAGVVTGLLAFLIVPWTLAAISTRRAAAVSVIATVSLLLSITVLPAPQLERIASTRSEIESGSLNDRTVLWSAAWAIFGEHTLAGVGAGASRVEIRERTGLSQGAHNTFLSVTAELGVIGLAFFVMVLLAFFRRALAPPGLERRLAAVTMLVVIVGLQVRHWEYDKTLWAVLAILIGLASSATVRTSSTVVYADRHGDARSMKSARTRW